MGKPLTVPGGLSDVHFVEVSRATRCGDGARHEKLDVPALPGGYLRAEFDFESTLRSNDGLEEPRFDIVWRVDGEEDDAEFVAGALLPYGYKYVRVAAFDSETGDGTAVVDVPLLATDLGYPPLFPGDNTVEILLGQEGALCLREDGGVDGVDHQFDPVEIEAFLPAYALNVLRPDMNLQDRCESAIVVVAGDVVDHDRTVALEMEFDPHDPCGVDFPETLLIPAGEAVATGTVRFSPVRGGNDAAVAVFRGAVGDETFTSMPLEFSNLLLLSEGATETPYAGETDSWAKCVRNARALPARPGQVRRTSGPCDTDGLLDYTCPKGAYGFYVPHKCRFSLSTDCQVFSRRLNADGWRVAGTRVVRCRTMRFNRRTGRWDLVRGSRRLCFWRPTGNRIQIVVDDCRTV